MSRFTFFLILPIVLAFSGCSSPTLEIYDLRCENLTDPLAIDNAEPHLSWKIKSSENGTEQRTYQILAASDIHLLNEEKADVWNSGKVSSPASVFVAYEGKQLPSGTLVYWKVRVWNENDHASKWSKPALFGTGLSESDWKGAYIGLSAESGDPKCPLLSKSFDVTNKSGKLLLYVNSLGYHEVYVNGNKVGEDILSPAVSQFDKRSLYLTYDISSYVQKGKNDLAIWLGQGWYRPGLPGVVYEGPLVKVQLEKVKGDRRNTILVSDSSWQARESGYISVGTWRPHQFGGEGVDAIRIPESLTAMVWDQSDQFPAKEVDVPRHAVSAQMSETNHITEIIEAKEIKSLNDTAWLVDMGKNLTGRAEIRFPQLRAGQKIVMDYCDFLDNTGNLDNRKQRDYYIASGKENETFKAKFNYHGFRYVEISGLTSPPKKEDIKAYLIHTNYNPASSFQCSDDEMNAIHDMIQYTFRCLTLGGYMVDCPQLERLGYGGDGNASTQTAQTMYDMSPLYANWMRAWGDCIREDGGLPHTAPCPYMAGGGPYWCGFVIMAPWETYVNYGDPRLIEKYYPVMQQWLGYAEKHFVDGMLEQWPNTDYRNWYLGDWACPKGIDQTAKASICLVNNCVMAECYQTMEKIARTLGKPDDAEKYAGQNNTLRRLIQERCFNGSKNTYATGTQIDLTFPMLTRVTPDSLVQKVTESLYIETVQNRQGHIACGLVGIPVLTEWAMKSQAKDLMYPMLKKKDYPGYLYMIENGATTTWEHWNGDRSRIHNCYNGIGSWFYQAIGGIVPDEKYPGYRKIFISPQIPEGITWAKTTKETPYGTLIVDWKLNDGVLNMDVTIPVGCEAEIVLPEKASEYTLNGTVCHRKEPGITVKSGKYTVSYQISK